MIERREVQRREKGLTTVNGECDDKDMGDCRGPVTTGHSRSGASVYEKCEKHWREYEERMNAVHADINSRYPGYNVPGSPPPRDFDPLDAGERWDEED